MIQVNELRCGNLLQWLDGSILKVEPEDIVLIARWDASKKLLPKPIPLNEQWLIAAGFEFYDYAPCDEFDEQPDGIWKRMRMFCNEYKTAWYDIYFLDDESEFGFSIMRESDSPLGEEFFIKELKSFHQLQNLYFALTRNELNFDLTKIK